ncbi:MAG TPA: RNA polymerase sigma-70 factor [Puia sp.]
MPLEAPYNEAQLLARVAGGDEYAFGRLFHAWHQELAGYIFLITRSMPLTEEIVQDTFTKIWVGREQLPGVTNFRSWLFTISRNHTLNCLRAQARETEKKQRWAVHALRESRDETAIDPEVQRQQAYRLIELAINQLPPQQKKAYLLSRSEGLSHEDIAREMLLSRETVKRHITLALRSIKEYVRVNAGRILLGIALILTHG